VYVKAGSDMYTALSGVACLVVLLGLIALWTSSYSVFGDNLFFPSNPPSAGR
jgi:hypothetical protein